MKIQTLTVLAAVATPLILTGSAQAGYLGIKATSKPNDFGLLVVNVYANFDRPDPGDGSGDSMIAVAGTPNIPMNIKVTGGQFYNHAFGTDIAPQASLVAAFNSLAYDTFVTIGVKKVGDPNVFPGAQPKDNMVITPDFPIGITGSVFATTISGWAVIPTALQGDPFNQVNSFPGNGEILIASFSTQSGSAIQGTMLVKYVSNGKSGSSIVSFFVPGPGGLPALALFCAMRARRRR